MDDPKSRWGRGDDERNSSGSGLLHTGAVGDELCLLSRTFAGRALSEEVDLLTNRQLHYSHIAPIPQSTTCAQRLPTHVLSFTPLTAGACELVAATGSGAHSLVTVPGHACCTCRSIFGRPVIVMERDQMLTMLCSTAAPHADGILWHQPPCPRSKLSTGNSRCQIWCISPTRHCSKTRSSAWSQCDFCAAFNTTWCYPFQVG